MINEDIKVFFMALETKEVKTIQMTYDGSGDSGNVENTSFQDKDGAEIELKEFEEKAIELADHILAEYYTIDWYNNEGGFGTITVDIVEKTWSIDGYCREMTSVQAPADGNLKEVINSFDK